MKIRNLMEIFGYISFIEMEFTKLFIYLFIRQTLCRNGQPYLSLVTSHCWTS
jgi:hypothetical protein